MLPSHEPAESVPRSPRPTRARAGRLRSGAVRSAQPLLHGQPGTSRPAGADRGGSAPAPAFSSADDFYRAAPETGDQAKAERDVRPPGGAGLVRLEGICRPHIGILTCCGDHSLVWMPPTRAIAILENPLEEPRPILVALQETESSHELEPVKRERDIRVDSIAMWQE